MKMRDPAYIAEAIKPFCDQTLQAELDSLITSIHYSAPELLSNRWHQLIHLLNSSRDSIQDADAVRAILNGTSEDPKIRIMED